MVKGILKGKNILLTGATSGIGYTIACQLAESGANLVLTGRNQEKLKVMKDKFGENPLYVCCDLSNLSGIEEIFEVCRQNKRKLDGMIHSAGIAKNCILRANDWMELEEVMRVNCLSFFELGRCFGMKKYSNDGGTIIAISSIASLLNDTGMAQYSASKAALNSAVKTMSKEFVHRHIRVNAILPANVNTEFFTSGVDVIEGFMESALERQPLGIIEPEQIAYLSEFLLSDYAKYITGELIVVSGGMTY